MSINNAIKVILKLLSYPDIKLKKNYKLIRKVHTATYKRKLSSVVDVWDDYIETENRKVLVRFFTPNKAVKYPITIFFHGGGWVLGNVDSYSSVCSYLAYYTKSMIISVDYRLAPEHPFPAGLEDCYGVSKAIFESAKSHFGIDPDQISLIGDSAGANLAAAVSLRGRDEDSFYPRSQVLIYPAVNNDFSNKSPFASVTENGKDYILTQKKLCDYMELYKSSDEDLHNPYFAPLLAEDLSKQPRTLILTAELDPLRDEGEAYGKKLKAFGNEVKVYRIPNVLHGFFSLPPKYPFVKQSYQIIKDFLRKE